MRKTKEAKTTYRIIKVKSSQRGVLYYEVEYYSVGIFGKTSWKKSCKVEIGNSGYFHFVPLVFNTIDEARSYIQKQSDVITREVVI